MALDANCYGNAVADIDDTSILARTDEHPGCLRWQPSEMATRRLIRAMLGPHDRIHGEFEMVRLTDQ